MSLLQTFLTDNVLSIEKEIELLEPNVREDYSEFVYVDGEEGDYGRIKYYLDNELIATKTIEGGDSEYYDWTPKGKHLLGKLLVEAIESSLQVDL